jgi:hypothetical protein
MPLPLSETEFQQQIVELAVQLGWKHMHVRRTRGKTKAGWKWLTATNVEGWPDLFFWHEQHKDSFYAELKADNGVTSTDQKRLIGSLRAAGLEVHVWAPRDWNDAEARLTVHQRAKIRKLPRP